MTRRRYFASTGDLTRQAEVRDGAARMWPAGDADGKSDAEAAGTGGPSADADAPPAESDGPPAEIRVLSGDGRIMVSLGERSAIGFGERREGVWHIELEGRAYAVRVDDERTHRIRRLSAAITPAGGEVELRAPMPGLVVRIAVEAGDEIREGDGLVVMEAMKMENELRAERDGVVERVHVAEGTTVDRDEVLVTFEVGQDIT